MFDSQPEQDRTAQRLTRRIFVSTAAAAMGGIGVYRLLGSPSASYAADEQTPAPGAPVKIVQFADDGKRLQTVTVPKVVKSNHDWKKQLSGNAYDITRQADTEMAYTGSLWNQHGAGLYRCICCGTALFSSETKFESHTGWPSFWAPVAKENVEEQNDQSFGMERTAVACRLCDAHLGHLFNDGPQPTGLRYCMNSASLRFVPKSA